MGSFKDFYIHSFSLLCEGTVNSLIEEGTGFLISDLKTNAPSERNKKFLKIRQQEGQNGSQLVDVEWNEDIDALTLIYKVIPTHKEEIHKATDKKAIVRTLDGKDQYEVKIMFEDVEKWLGRRQEFLNLPKMEQIEFVSLMIKGGTVKVHSNDMSYFFQGVWDNADKLGFAIDPFPAGVNRGKGIWSRRHKSEYPAIYLTKHILEVLTTVAFLANTIAKKIREKYEKK